MTKKTELIFQVLLCNWNSYFRYDKKMGFANMAYKIGWVHRILPEMNIAKNGIRTSNTNKMRIVLQIWLKNGICLSIKIEK